MCRDQSTRTTIRRLLAVVLVCGLSPCGSTDAADWIFRRSYYSHHLPPEVAANSPVPHNYSAYRPAVISPYPGFGATSIQRYNTVVIPNGLSLDVTVQRSENFRSVP